MGISLENIPMQLTDLAYPSPAIDEAVYSRTPFLERGELHSNTTSNVIIRVVLAGVGCGNPNELAEKVVEIAELVLVEDDVELGIPPNALIRRAFESFEDVVADKYGRMYQHVIDDARRQSLGAVAIALHMPEVTYLAESA